MSCTTARQNNKKCGKISKRMQEYRNELNLIGNCNRKTQKALFQHAHGDFIRAIVDAIWTMLEGKLPLKPEQLSSVRKNKLTLRRIASKNQTLGQRRQLLCKQRGGNAAIDLLNIVKEYF